MKGYFRNLWETIKFYWVIVLIGIIVATIVIATWITGSNVLLKGYEAVVSLIDKFL